MINKKDIGGTSLYSKKIFNLIKKTERKSALDYKYWETKVLHQINNDVDKIEFEKNFLNLFILSKNNKKKNKTLKLYYLRNIPRFSDETGRVVLSKY